MVLPLKPFYSMGLRGLGPRLHRRPSAPLLVLAMAKRKKGSSSKSSSSSGGSKGGSKVDGAGSAGFGCSPVPDPTAGGKGFGPTKAPTPPQQQQQRRPQQQDRGLKYQQLGSYSNLAQDTPQIEGLGKPAEWCPTSDWDTVLASDADTVAANLNNARKLLAKLRTKSLVPRGDLLYNVGNGLVYMLDLRNMGVDMAEEAARALAATWSWMEVDEVNGIPFGYSRLAQVGEAVD